jgi:hypothetical protein
VCHQISRVHSELSESCLRTIPSLDLLSARVILDYVYEAYLVYSRCDVCLRLSTVLIDCTMEHGTPPTPGAQLLIASSVYGEIAAASSAPKNAIILSWP